MLGAPVHACERFCPPDLPPKHALVVERRSAPERAQQQSLRSDRARSPDGALGKERDSDRRVYARVARRRQAAPGCGDRGRAGAVPPDRDDVIRLHPRRRAARPRNRRRRTHIDRLRIDLLGGRCSCRRSSRWCSISRNGAWRVRAPRRRTRRSSNNIFRRLFKAEPVRSSLSHAVSFVRSWQWPN
jgi:hypothetical protein